MTMHHGAAREREVRRYPPPDSGRTAGAMPPHGEMSLRELHDV